MPKGQEELQRVLANTMCPVLLTGLGGDKMQTMPCGSPVNVWFLPGEWSGFGEHFLRCAHGHTIGQKYGTAEQLDDFIARELEAPRHPNRKGVLDDLIQEAFTNSTNKGFWLAKGYNEDVPFASMKLMLIVTEIAEMMEGLRKPGPDQHCPAFANVAIEAADVLIRLCDFCGAYNIDLAAALEAKLAYNRSRPHMHGKTA